MKQDTIEYLGKHLIQHGPLSQRIYLMKCDVSSAQGLPARLHDMARQCRYTKIFAKIPSSLYARFKQAGYVNEASVPAFYKDEQDANFLCLYLDPDRGVSSVESLVSSVLKQCGVLTVSHRTSKDGYTAGVVKCGVDDVDEIAELYSQVFKSYPFPIHDSGYILKTMQENVIYFAMRIDGRLVAISSAEMDIENSNVEMSDFAILEQQQGRGFASILLAAMEQEMLQLDMRTAYAIARAAFGPINFLFAKRGYIHGGCLINNTNICGKLEDMNVWYKRLA